MNVKHATTHRTFSAKRLLATALISGAVLASAPLLAQPNTQAVGAQQTTASSPTRAVARNSEALDVSSSRINGRIDWDVDYPSQLAPQPVHVARPVDDVAGSAPASPTQVTMR